MAQDIKCVLTVEENTILGGFGSAVLEYLTELGIKDLRIKRLGIPDRFIEQGSQGLLRKRLGLDAEGIAREAIGLIKEEANKFSISLDIQDIFKNSYKR